jgi:hypothetical protein
MLKNMPLKTWPRKSSAVASDFKTCSVATLKICAHGGARKKYGLWGANTEGVIALTSRRRGALDDGGRGAQVLRLLVLAIAAIFRPKALPIAENLCARQQLIVLQRRHPRPRLSDADRRFGSWQADGSASCGL